MNEQLSREDELRQIAKREAQAILAKSPDLIKDLTPDDEGYYTLTVLMSASENPEEESFVQACGMLASMGVPGVTFINKGNLEDEDDEMLTIEQIMAMPKYRTVMWNPDEIQKFLES